MNWSASAAAWRLMFMAQATRMELKSISILTMAIPGSNGSSRLHSIALRHRGSSCCTRFVMPIRHKVGGTFGRPFP